MITAVILLFALAFIPVANAGQTEPVDPRIPALVDDLEEVRLALGIPGMSAAVVEGREIIWSGGLGFADFENEVPAAASTPFGLASVTKPLAATLIMQLVEEGLIDLDRPVSEYGIDLAGGVTVRHLLTHTSEGTPGLVHSYNGNRYGLLGGVIEAATGRTFADLLGERILNPLGMMDTALNPLNSWGDRTVHGLEDFARSFGWGDSFGHYPDVYQRLAMPYQFGEEYETIPGMYHVHHNPAAGAVSSANDLARFDIALDDGLILGEETVEQMFAPAVGTQGDRPEFNYGLGWYVQEFEGLQLIWHTGRWPPSTSALYVKIPEMDLTFVVLANTDNLTVPFPGIGFGDLSRSLPMLTFFRHFVVPEKFNFDLPDVDWASSQAQLVAQLSSVDGDAERFLERELWSMRQALASAGRVEQADLLRRAGVTAFPGSTLQMDPNTTNTVARREIVEPIPGVRAYRLMSIISIAWLALVLVSLIWMARRLFRSRPSPWEWFVWMIGTFLLGPLALFVQRRAAMRGIPAASFASATGYGVAWILTIVILSSTSDETSPVVTIGSVLLVPLLVGLLAIRAPLLRRGGAGRYLSSARRGMVAEWMSAFVAVGGMFFVTFYVQERWFSMFPGPSSPYFWTMMSIVTAVGFAVLLVLHALVSRRGFTVWPLVVYESAVRFPTVRDSWWMLVAAFAFMAALFAVAVSWFS